MTGRGGHGGKRALSSGAGDEGRKVPRIANAAGAAAPPPVRDQHDEDGVRAGASSTPFDPNASRAAVFPGGVPFYNGAAEAQIPTALVNGSGGSAIAPMVEFTAPPPPPLFEAPLFPFSPSMAAAAGMPPPMSFPGISGMPFPGYSPYGSQPHVPHPQMMPPGLTPMMPAGMMGRPPTNSFFGTAMAVNAESGAQLPPAGQPDEPIFSAAAEPPAHVGAAALSSSSAPSSAAAAPAAQFSATTPAPTASSPGAGAPGAALADPSSSRSLTAHLSTLAAPSPSTSPTTPARVAALPLVRPSTPPALRRAGRRGGPRRPRIVAAPNFPQGSGRVAPPSRPVEAAARPISAAAIPVDGAVYTAPYNGAPVNASPAGLNPAVPASRGVAAVAPSAARAARRLAPAVPMVPPVSTLFAALPAASPPAVVPSRASASTGPLAVFAAPPVAPRVPPTEHLAPSVVRGAAIESSPRAAAATRAPRGAYASGRGNGGVEAVRETAAAGAAEPHGPVGDQVATQSEMNTLAKLITTATGLVSALSAEVKSMVQKVQTQGGSIERLGVAISEFQKRPRPTRRFVPPDVEEYSDHEELISMFGYGGPILSEAADYVTKAGVKLSEMKKGALMMLNIRARVKSRSFGDVGGAVMTKDVMHHPDVDFEMVIEVTMDEHKMDEAEAYKYLTSWISGPEPRIKTPKQVAAEKKRAEAYKAKHGKEKPKSNPSEKRRAYQPVMQSISHMYEAIKRPVVAAWFEAVERSELAMTPAEAAEWLTDVNPRKKPEEPSQARFMASARGRPAMTVAMHAMYIHLGVSDRIRAPKHCGDVEAAHGTSGHYALALMFVRNALTLMASGNRRRSGIDSGWYDLWRAELEALKDLLPNNTAPWNGLVFTDGNDTRRFEFDVAPAPIVGKRGRFRVPPAPGGGGGTVTGGSASVDVGSASGGSPVGASSADRVGVAPSGSAPGGDTAGGIDVLAVGASGLGAPLGGASAVTGDPAMDADDAESSAEGGTDAV